MTLLTEKWRTESTDCHNGLKYNIVTETTLCEILAIKDKETAEHIVRVHNHGLTRPSCPLCKSFDVAPDYGKEFQEGEDHNPFGSIPYYCGDCNHTWGGD